MRLRLVVPTDVGEPTGGNVYDLAVAAAAQRVGVDVTVVGTDAAHLAEALLAPWAGDTIVDGLLAAQQPTAISLTRPAVLAHMPLGLQTGLTATEAAAIDAAERKALRAASVVIATSNWSASRLRERHGLTEVAVAAPGVDPADLVTGSNPPLLVHVAALLPHKDQLGVVAALDSMRDLPWQARLVGSTDRDPAYATQVRRAVGAARLSGRVDITGPLARDNAWAGADLALLPSRVESFGLVVTEALARGVPAIVSDTGAAEALGAAATGIPGAVIPIGDAGALSAILRRWLSDADYRRALRENALSRRAKLDTWDVTAQRILAVLRSANTRA